MALNFGNVTLFLHTFQYNFVIETEVKRLPILSYLKFSRDYLILNILSINIILLYLLPVWFSEFRCCHLSPKILRT